MPPQPHLPRSTPRALLPVLAVLLVAAAACERETRPPIVDTAAPVVATPPAPVVEPPSSGWVEAAGPVLLVRSPQAGGAQVVFPQLVETAEGGVDTASVRETLPSGTEVVLLSRAGRVGEARVAAPASAEEAPASAGEGSCTTWPAASLEPTEAGAPPAGWTVGFVAGTVEPIPLDSIEAASRADSTRLAAAVTRLAATLPNDTAAQFRGLPFAVRSARRFTPAPGVEAVVAELVRKVSLEAMPLEEHILLLAERPAGRPAARFTPVYFERAIGAEDEVVTSEVLAAARVVATGNAILVLYRDLYSGGRYALLERVAPGEWRRRWTSLYTGC